MVANEAGGISEFSSLAPLILKPLRKRRGVLSADMAHKMAMSPRAYEDFENGKVKINLDKIRSFARVLNLDPLAILAAFQLRMPRMAMVFANNKFMLIQATAVQDLDEEAQDALAAVDPLTILDAHAELYRQLVEKGRDQLRVTERAHELLSPNR